MVERQARVALEPDQAQNFQGLFDSENDREPPFRSGADKAESCPVSIESLFEEELDPADGYGGSPTSILPDVSDVEEVLVEFYFCNLVWSFVIVVR